LDLVLAGRDLGYGLTTLLQRYRNDDKETFNWIAAFFAPNLPLEHTGGRYFSESIQISAKFLDFMT
jgi:hypothetical protein